MGVEIMDVVPVELGLEFLVGRACEEVEAAVVAEDVARLLNNRTHRREADHVVIARAAGQLTQILRVAAGLRGVDVVQLDAKLLGVLNGVDALRSGQSLVVDIGDDQQAGTAVAVQRVVDRAEAHRADGSEKRHLAALDNAHLVLVGAGLGVVHGVERADDAAHRLGQGAVEINVGVIRQQAVHQQRFDGNVAILCVAAAVLIGIAGSHLGAFVEMGGLNGEALTGLVLVLPVLADLLNDAAELVTDNGRMLGNIVGNALVLRAFDRRLIGAHADRVRNDLDLYVVRADLRQLDLFQTKIHLSVNANSFRFHIQTFLSVASACAEHDFCKNGIMLYCLDFTLLYRIRQGMSTSIPYFSCVIALFFVEMQKAAGADAPAVFGSFRFCDRLDDPRDGGAQNGVDAELHKEIDARQHNKHIVYHVRTAGPRLKRGTQHRRHRQQENAGVYDRRAHRGKNAAKRLLLPQRAVDQPGHPSGSRRLDEAGQDRPYRACLNQRLCTGVVARQAGDRRDKPEDCPQQCARTRPVEHSADHDGHQRQRDRDRADLDVARHGLQDDDQRRQQCQRNHSDYGCMIFVFICTHKIPPAVAPAPASGCNAIFAGETPLRPIINTVCTEFIVFYPYRGGMPPAACFGCAGGAVRYCAPDKSIRYTVRFVVPLP